MSFVLRYRMFSGAADRLAETAQDVIEAHTEIRLAGGELVGIIDGAGRAYSLEELVATLPEALRDPAKTAL